MVLAKRFAYVPLVAVIAGVVAAVLTTPGRWSISLVVILLARSPPAETTISRSRCSSSGRRTSAA
jgi:uncharacterized membrane protein YdbT with pleckstrin-like domain